MPCKQGAVESSTENDMVWLDIKHSKPSDCQVFHDLDDQFGGFTLGNHSGLHKGFGILPTDPMKKGDILPIKVHLDRLHAFPKTLLILAKSIGVLPELVLRSPQLPGFVSPTR